MSDLKKLRGQLRQVTKEVLPEVLTEQLTLSLHASLKKHIDSRLDAIENFIKSTLTSLDQRTKDTQSYLIRQITSPQVPAPRDLDLTVGTEDEA